MHGVIARRQRDLVGIVNGIDVDRWNPATDTFVPSHFTADDDFHKWEKNELGICRVAADKGAQTVLDRAQRDTCDLNFAVERMVQSSVGRDGEVAAQLRISPDYDPHLISGIEGLWPTGALRLSGRSAQQ